MFKDKNKLAGGERLIPKQMTTRAERRMEIA
jgi:hypothetical protein